MVFKIQFDTLFLNSLLHNLLDRKFILFPSPFSILSAAAAAASSSSLFVLLLLLVLSSSSLVSDKTNEFL